MIDFVIVGLPRSGTTWAANWLTTGKTICVHDPLYTTHYSEWDSLVEPGSTTGVSCTGIWRWADWLNSRPARKLVLHRPLHEVNESMQAIGLQPLAPQAEAMLSSIEGLHVDYTSLFDASKARELWEYLTPEPFSRRRHEELVHIEMQPAFHGLSVGAEVTRRLREELERMY